MGRHREFDEEEALDAALAVFWEKGYEGTSFDDLTCATHVARPGLYAAFGNKESLFFKALDRYSEKYASTLTRALQEPTSFKVVASYLRETVRINTMYRSHPGCLGLNGAMACSAESEPIRLELVHRRARSEAALSARLKRAQKEADLPAASRPQTLARLVMSLAQGISVQAKAGVRKASLLEMVEQFLRFWPRRASKKSARAKAVPLPRATRTRARA